MGEDHDAAFTAFAATSLRDLRSTAYLVCGDWHLAEDVAQEALVRMYGAWDRVEREEARLAYARRTTVRLAIDQGRRPWRRERPGDLSEESVVHGVDRWARTGTPGQVDDRDLVDRALAGLAPKQRACVVLRFHLDCSVAETARVLGVTEGTVKSQTSDALARLRAALGEFETSGGGPR